jgi:putative zinc finger/helix-turn-helix YgiT family protein
MKPFPWKCRTCRKVAVAQVTIPYTTEVQHDGRTYSVQLPALEVLRCSECGAIVLDDAANARISEAFRYEAGLLTPAQIRQQREALGLTQKRLACLLDVSESTLSRWETGIQIQQRAMDKLLRAFFDLPEFRRYLGFHEREAPGVQAASKTTTGTATLPTSPQAGHARRMYPELRAVAGRA